MLKIKMELFLFLYLNYQIILHHILDQIFFLHLSKIYFYKYTSFFVAVTSILPWNNLWIIVLLFFVLWFIKPSCNAFNNHVKNKQESSLLPKLNLFWLAIDTSVQNYILIYYTSWGPTQFLKLWGFHSLRISDPNECTRLL